jgi:hypothetical protein
MVQSPQKPYRLQKIFRKNVDDLFLCNYVLDQYIFCEEHINVCLKRVYHDIFSLNFLIK